MMKESDLIRKYWFEKHDRKSAHKRKNEVIIDSVNALFQSQLWQSIGVVLEYCSIIKYEQTRRQKTNRFIVGYKNP